MFSKGWEVTVRQGPLSSGSAAGRIWLSAFVMRAERREVRVRARAVMGSIVAAMAVVTGLATLLRSIPPTA